jgi:hypothetical protein
MKIYYITNQLGYWVNPVHAYRRNWFTKKEDAETRKETFENWFIFNNTKYTIQEIDVTIDTTKHDVDYYSDVIIKAILENTTSNFKAKELMLESGIEYADIDKIIYYFNCQFENVDTSSIRNYQRPIVTADTLKEFMLIFLLPYEQAYFNNLVDDFFGTK